MAVYGPINSHLWAWKDDGEFRRQASFARDRRFAWNDHFLEDSAMRWRGYEDQLQRITTRSFAALRMTEGESTGMTEGGGLRGFLFRACHSFYLHSPVQSLFSNYPGGRGLFLL